jgi:predicted TIM-barrel fold metal-dependent hydrolase
VLFGTDMPLGGPDVVGETIADVDSLGLSAADRERIYSGNARHVLRV